MFGGPLPAIKLFLVSLLFVELGLASKGLATSVTVGTYNLHNLENPSGLKKDLLQLNFVDVWGFQEVMFYGNEVDPDFTSSLPTSAKYLIAVPIAIVTPEISRREGHAIASRYPIESTGLIPLEANTPKPRSALFAVINIENKRILFVNTDHDVDFFNIGYWERRKNVESLLKGIRQLNFNGPVVLVGDFNTADSYKNWSQNSSGAHEVRLTQNDFLQDGWTTPSSYESEPYTLKQFGVTQQLDHFFLKGIEGFTPWSRFNERIGSDHFPLFMEIEDFKQL